MRQGKRVALSCLLLLSLAVAAASAAEESGVTTREGKLSSVELIEITSANRDRPWPELVGAPDGLRFIFMVFRKPGVRGLFTLREVRDFKVDRQSYRELTRRVTAREFEPTTTVWSVRQFLGTQRPDLTSRIPIVADREANVLVVTIGGMALPAEGRCDITIEVGWGSGTEQFSFSRGMVQIKRRVQRQAHPTVDNG